MDKKEFNAYCAKVMGWHSSGRQWSDDAWLNEKGDYVKAKDCYNPYNYLDLRVPVFDKLYGSTQGSMHKEHDFMYKVLTEGLDKATKDFIISTMEEL